MNSAIHKFLPQPTHLPEVVLFGVFILSPTNLCPVRIRMFRAEVSEIYILGPPDTTRNIKSFTRGFL